MSAANRPDPPRAWRALLGAVAPPHERRWILADLSEEYGERLARTPITARAWYRRQVLASVLPLLGRRLRLAARGLGPHPRGELSMSVFLNDLRCGWRTLRATPLVSLLVIAVLALGIGANTAIFSLMNPILLRPLPYRDADRLVHMFSIDRSVGGFGADLMRQSLPTLRVWEGAETLEEVAGYYYRSTSLRAAGGLARGITTGYLTANLIPLLGVEPALGRVFHQNEDAPGRNNVLLLSDGQWHGQFGGDPAIVGREVFLDGEAHTVIGVMAPDFNFPYSEVRAWKPAGFDPERWGHDDHGILTLGRLAPGITADQARQELAGMLAGLAEEYGGPYAERGLRVVGLRRALVFFYDILGAILTALLFAGGFVLLIVCANVANLLLSQVGRRRREIAVRAALGAGRGRILRQLLTESALLAIIAGIVALTLARAGVGLLAPLIPAALYRVGEIRVDGATTLFAVGLTLLTVIGFGLLPAWKSSGVRVTETLKATSQAGRRGRLARVLIFGQVSAATLLCGGAFLAVDMARGFAALPIGFDTDGILTVRVSLPRAGYPDAARVLGFHDDVHARLEALPGVEAVGFISELPLDFSVSTTAYHLPGDNADADAVPAQATSTAISAGYLSAMGVPLLRGRAFDQRDRADGEAVVIVNRTLANRLWPGGGVGEVLVLEPGADAVEATVIGVVGDTLGGIALNGVQDQLYLPLAQRPYRGGFFTVRTGSDPASRTDDLRRAIAEIDPELPLEDVRTMREVADAAGAPLMTARNLVGGLAGFALVLAALGVYGVVAYAVTRRTHEIGVRLALGARPRHIRRTVMAATVVTVVVAATLGVAGTLGLQVGLTAAVGEDAGPTPTGAVLVGLILVGVGMLAAWLPTRRATRIDPLLALRHAL